MEINNRILVIDDEQKVLDAFVSVFSSQNNTQHKILEFILPEQSVDNIRPLGSRRSFQFNTALQGEAGFLKIKQSLSQKHPYSVVFIDMRMPPGWNGQQTVRAIREIDPHIQIVIVTAYSDISIEEVLMGFSGTERLLLLKKPFCADEIYQLADSLSMRWTIENTEINRKHELEQEIAQRTLEIQQMNETLIAANEKAISVSESKSMFLANMSHEIRTPMNAIIGLTHLLMRTQQSPQQEDYALKIQSSSNLLLGIINDILDFSKIEAGKLEMERIRFSVSKVLSNVGTLMVDKAERKGLEIIFSNPLSLPKTVIGDPLRLGQILTNLVRNSIKFTETGEIIVSVRAISRNEEAITLRFSVKDTGIGLSREQSSRLFEPFCQGDTSTTRQFGGTGLGLSISKHLVALMGGTIGVESEPGKGADFFFTAVFEVDKSDEVRVNATFKDKKVLVVDDSDTSRRILSSVLEELSFSVSSVGSGFDAIKELERVALDPTEQCYDLVLMDWRMPDMDGLETTEKIHTNISLPSTPLVIMVTAYDRADVMRQIRDIQLDGFLLKPITPSVLVDTVLQAFGISEQKSTPEQHFHYKINRAFKGKKILLVEDNKINQQIASELLSGEGFNISIACNGIEAIEKLSEHRFDLILMDIQMPLMDGYEATKAIRKDAKYQRLPIIAMTANAMKGDREKCLEAGMNDHIGKPIDLNHLYSTLDRWLSTQSTTKDTAIPTQALASGLFDVDGIDTQYGLQRVRHNESLYVDLLFIFKDEFANAMQEIKQALSQNNPQIVDAIIHSIKGTSGSIGAHHLHTVSEALEDAIQQKSDETGNLLAQFEHALNTVIKSIAGLRQQPGVPELLAEMDLNSLTPHLQQLHHFLLNRSSKSLKYIKNIQPLKQIYAQEFLALEKNIQQFEFKNSLKILTNLSEKLNIVLSEEDLND